MDTTGIPQPKGTIVFSTVGRTEYGFDVFSVNLKATTEQRLTDGLSVNFNAQFIEDDDDDDDKQQSLVFISERTGSPRIYLTRPHFPKPQQLLLPNSTNANTNSLFHDRPIIKNQTLYFISAHEQPPHLLTSWSALYSCPLSASPDKITRLTPYGSVDYSPALSQSAKYVAVASYGSRPWAGEFNELNTDILVFHPSEPHKRFLVCEHGGWPSWSGDSTIFFHRQADDKWWSIFRIDIPNQNLDEVTFPLTPVRITPPGVHCFTPAAMHNDAKRIAVATRRQETKYRHIEIFDLQSQTFSKVTELLNPSFHHYNPFVSPDSRVLGYHRFRGEGQNGETTIPHLEPVESPEKGLKMLRLNGNFPAFTPCGGYIACNYALDMSQDPGVKIIKSDGSKSWMLVNDRVAFYNAWSPTERHVIYTSLGPIFESVKTTVQIARIKFDPAYLDNDDTSKEKGIIPCDVKILTREETGNNAFPSCSPDGKYLVLRSGRTGHKNLYIMDAVNGEYDGGSIRQLTDGPWIDTMPSWSPRGDLIAFSSNRHNPQNTEAFGIYVIKPDGSDCKRIPVAGPKDASRERLNHVCFSQDGEWLLFASNLGGVTAEPVSWPHQFQPYGDLYAIRLDGTGLKRLTWHAYENGTPAWHHTELDFNRIRRSSGEKLSGAFDDPYWITCDL